MQEAEFEGRGGCELSRVLLGLVFVFLLIMGLSAPVWAIGNPDSVSVRAVFAFEDVLVSGDQLYFVRYDVSYDPVPSEDADDTWQMALYDVGGGLVATVPLNYYQHNIMSIYLTPAQAIAWEADHVIKVMGMPSVFGNLTEGINMRSATLGSGDYLPASDLESTMVEQAKVLEADWEVTLLTSADKLNTTGTTFFLEAVPNLNTMIPSLFETTVVYPEVDYVPWSRPYEDTLEAHEGDRLDAAIKDIADLLHTSEAWAGAWIMSMAYILFAGIIYSGTKNPSMSFIGAFPILIGGMWLGVGGSAFLTGVLLIVFVTVVIFAIYFILGRFA